MERYWKFPLERFSPVTRLRGNPVVVIANIQGHWFLTTGRPIRDYELRAVLDRLPTTWARRGVVTDKVAATALDFARDPFFCPRHLRPTHDRELLVADSGPTFYAGRRDPGTWKEQK